MEAHKEHKPKTEVYTVKDHIFDNYGDCARYDISYKSQYGEFASMPYKKFIEKYGNRRMGDKDDQDFCFVDGTRCLNQYIIGVNYTKNKV